MARNKYPEETYKKILEVSYRLFFERGYENTTIQDIVDEMGGLTKGALYHHFKSKEDIILAVIKQLFVQDNVFDAVRADQSLNGLQKLKRSIELSMMKQNEQGIEQTKIMLTSNPRFLAKMLEIQIGEIVPILEEIIAEGIADGSIKSDDARIASELIILLTSIWLNPSIYPTTKELAVRRLQMANKLLLEIGIDIFDNDVMEQYKKDIDK